MQEAIDKAKNGFIVTFGIVPTNQKQDTDTLKEMAITYFLSEKTKSSFSERFYCQRKLLWNSGMFCFKQVFY
jgi:mannose-1-phosphate guanylyltransferase